MSVALAAVSVVLAVTQAQHLTPKQLVYPLGLYAAAACLYAIFAITERRLFARIGFGLLVIATLLGVMIWLDPVAAAQLLPAL